MSFSVPGGIAVVMDKKKVRDYMTYDVVSVDFSGTAKDVIEKIQKTHHDGFPVVDGDMVVGYVSARDLLFIQPSTPVKDVMSSNLIVADPDMDINDAARVIFRSGIQKLPVVDEKNNSFVKSNQNGSHWKQVFDADEKRANTAPERLPLDRCDYSTIWLQVQRCTWQPKDGSSHPTATNVSSVSSDCRSVTERWYRWCRVTPCPRALP